MLSSGSRALTLKNLHNYKNALKLINPNCCFLFLSAKTLMEETSSLAASSLSSSCSSPSRQFHGDSTIGVQEWQSWGTSSPVPSMVSEIVEDLKLLEKESNAQITFGGHGGKIQVLYLTFLYICWCFCLFSFYPFEMGASMGSKLNL